MTPTERLLTILRLLGDAQDRRGAAKSTRIREKMGDVYDGVAGARMWRRDIRTLRERGLLETDQTTPTTPNRTGISLRVPPKPGPLHLTRHEHAAISQARRALRPGPSAVSPLGGAQGSEDREIDLGARIVRFLEENDDEVELVQLAEWLDRPESDVFGLIDIFTREGVVTEGLVRSIEFGYENDDPRPDTVRVIRGRSSIGSPTRGRGMDELGFFPYSLAETDDRLSLIEQALAADGMDEGLRPDLVSARSKLDEWRSFLTKRDAMS